MGLLALVYGSVSDDNFETGFSSRDGAFYSDDAVVITGEWNVHMRIVKNLYLPSN